MEKKDQWNIGYWIVAGLLLLTLQNYWQAAKTVEPVPYSEFEKALAESTQARIDQAIRDIVMGVFERAYRILDTNRAVLERCARELLARETLDENDILQLTQGLVLDGNEK